jgi:hypothetical protein
MAKWAKTARACVLRSDALHDLKWLSVLLLLLPASAQTPAAQETPQHEYCQVCHNSTVQDFLAHPHFKAGLECRVCHGESVEHRTAEGHQPPDRVALPEEIPALCGSCHLGSGPVSIADQYTQSKHGQLVMARSRTRSPHCGTCHGVHFRWETKLIENQCRRCHEKLPEACSGTPARQTAVSCAGCHTPHLFKPD